MNKRIILFIVVATILSLSIIAYLNYKSRDKEAIEHKVLYHLRTLALCMSAYSDMDPDTGNLLLPPSLDIMYNVPSKRYNLWVPPPFIYDNIKYNIGKRKRKIDYQIEGRRYDPSNEIWFYYPKDKEGNAYICIKGAVLKGRILKVYNEPVDISNSSTPDNKHK